jgi:hypothetical protein
MATGEAETPDDRLIFAALTGDLNGISQALREGANPDTRVEHGTLLHYTIIEQNYDAAEYLIAHGCEVNTPDRFGSTPLHLAAMHGRTGLAVQLMKRGADRQAKDGLGNVPRDLTAPHVAIEWDELSSQARRALNGKKGQELASLLIADGQPTQALLELCGTHRTFELFYESRWKGREREALVLYDGIQQSLPAYWKRFLEPEIDLTPLRRSAAHAANDDGIIAVRRYVRNVPGRP